MGCLAHPVLRHRIVPTFNAEAEGITVESIIDRCLEGVPEKKEAIPLKVCYLSQDG